MVEKSDSQQFDVGKLMAGGWCRSASSSVGGGGRQEVWVEDILQAAPNTSLGWHWKEKSTGSFGPQEPSSSLSRAVLQWSWTEGLEGKEPKPVSGLSFPSI